MFDSSFRLGSVTQHVSGLTSGFAQVDEGSSVSDSSWDNNANGGISST
jgi:hypothetical protein